MRIAALMSGTGSNLRRILESKNDLYEIVMIFSDTKSEKCNGKKIADEYGIAYYSNDIKEYYSDRGHNNRSDVNVRKEFDGETAKLLEKHHVDVIALCGYMSIVTDVIYDDYLTVNVHPADLRIIDENGKSCMQVALE